MAKIQYLDFDLLIGRSEGVYTARVLNSPAGQATADFHLPFSEIELENFLLRIGRPRQSVRRLESPEIEAAKAFGGRLFETIFAHEVRRCLRSSLDEADRQSAGLRIRLRLDAPELSDLPWEYLYNSDSKRFLSLSVETPLVRYRDLPGLIRPLAVKPPLRVLVMISSPSDYPRLDVELEWTKLKESLEDLEWPGLVKLERLETATLSALQRLLRRGEYHIFHFIGHGGFDEASQDGVLILEDEKERGRPLSGQYLGTMLYDERTLRLVILNACEGARTSRSDPFAGTAQSLVQQGIPAVIAMQFEITDEAATTLAHEFYAALADSYPVDAALTEARKAIFAQGNDVEWGTPVLYLRTPNGRIFDVEQMSEEERQQGQIAVLCRDAQAALARADWATAIEKLQVVLDLDPSHAEAMAGLRQARQQRELETFYAKGQEHYQAGRWREALECFQQVQAKGGNYKDVDNAIATTRRAMARRETGFDTSVRLKVVIPAVLMILLIVSSLILFSDQIRRLLSNLTVGKAKIAEEVNFANNPGLRGRVLYTARLGENLVLASSLADGNEPPDVLVENGVGAAMWSPDNSHIVFQRSEGAATNIFVADRDGSNPTQLTNMEAGKYARTPGWFPTKEFILYESNVAGNQEIYRIPNSPVEGKTSSYKITITAGGDSSSPAVSPDGRYLAFSSNADGDWDVYVLELGKEDKWTQLTDAPGSDEFPVWSPNGKQIAFSSERDGRFEIYIMNADGSQQQRLTITPEDKWSRVPAWSPDGKNIAFVSNQDDSIGPFYGDIFTVNVSNKVVRQLTFSGRIWTWRVSWAKN